MGQTNTLKEFSKIIEERNQGTGRDYSIENAEMLDIRFQV